MLRTGGTFHIKDPNKKHFVHSSGQPQLILPENKKFWEGPPPNNKGEELQYSTVQCSTVQYSTVQ